jgi:hypothetical protein
LKALQGNQACIRPHRTLGFFGSITLASAARSAAAWPVGPQTSSLSTLASNSALAQLQFKEMGMLSWLIVDLAINWGGWALATAFKVRMWPGHCNMSILLAHTTWAVFLV